MIKENQDASADLIAWDNEQEDEVDDTWDVFGEARIERMQAGVAAQMEDVSLNDQFESDEEQDTSNNQNRTDKDELAKSTSDPEYQIGSVITSIDEDTPATPSVIGGFSSRFLDLLGIKTNKGRLIEYEVTFDHGPVGLKLETDWYGKRACVRAFTKINGEPGPAKKSGLIHIGDVLVSINDKSVLEMSFKDAMQHLKSVSHGQHTLTFKASEAVFDSGLPLDAEINEARQFIHQQKERFYMPPNSASLDEDENRPSDGGVIGISGSSGDEMVYCCVERRRGNETTAFHLMREDTGEFICACSVDSDRTGVFIFHTLKDSHLRPLSAIPRSSDSAIYLGCMMPSLLGLSFVMYNHKVNEETVKAKNWKDEEGKNELCLVSYEANIMGRVPNFLKCVIPRPVPASEGQIQRHTIETRWTTIKRRRQVGDLGLKIKSAIQEMMHKEKDEDMLDFDREYTMVEQDNQQDLMIFETKKPVWNEQLSAWTLNFNGRVKIPSKKNFLIHAEIDNHMMEHEFGEDVYLRFGKMSKTRFSLDFRSPISPIVALGIATSAFADKIMVT